MSVECSETLIRHNKTPVLRAGRRLALVVAMSKSLSLLDKTTDNYRQVQPAMQPRQSVGIGHVSRFPVSSQLSHSHYCSQSMLANGPRV